MRPTTKTACALLAAALLTAGCKTATGNSDSSSNTQTQTDARTGASPGGGGDR